MAAGAFHTERSIGGRRYYFLGGALVEVSRPRRMSIQRGRAPIEKGGEVDGGCDMSGMVESS